MSSDIATRIAQLGSSLPAERADAAQYFATLGDAPGAAAAAKHLVEACGDADGQVRQWAEAALESLGPPEVGDVAALAAFVGRDHATQAYWAATLLGRLGPAAASARLALTEVVENRADTPIAKRAAWALAKIG